MASKELETAQAGFAPQTLDERVRFAQLLAEADMLPQQYRSSPANVLLAMEYGDSLGLPTVQAISTINVIDGKPSASAALISALVRREGHRLRIWGDDETATATITRSDDPEFEYKSVWNLDRAARAGLCQVKDGRPHARSKQGKVLPWEAYTAALLKARAITEVAREACQEALMGVQYTAEELGVVVDEDGNPVTDRRGGPVRTVTSETVTQPPKAPSKGGKKAAPKKATKTEPEPASQPDAEPASDGGDVVDAEPVAGPPPAPRLPEDFALLVDNAEENRDLEALRALHKVAETANNRPAQASVIAAVRRFAPDALKDGAS